MGIPATLIFLFSLVLFFPLASVQHTLLESIKLLSPNEKLYSAASRTIVDLMSNKRRELLSVGILATIFVSSNGVLGLIRSFDRKNPLRKERSALARRARAILLTLVLMVVLIIAITLLILQSHFVKEYLMQYFPHLILVKIISWVFLVFIIYIAVCIIYKYGPSLNKRFHFFSPGAMIATLSFFLVSYAFFFLANHFIHYNKIYGSVGTLLMFMVWMFCTGMAMSVGFEINLSIEMLDKKENSEHSLNRER